jgi:enoyl-CoA hydratase/carnithine racemase
VSLSEGVQALVEEHGLERAERRADAIVVARRAHTGVVLLDRPEVGNAHNRAMIRALSETWLEFDDDPDVRCMVMGSTNERHFCTGIDLKEVASSRFGDGSRLRGTGQTHRDVPVLKPMVAAVEGMVVGGGLHWVVEADIVVASDEATFRDTHVNVGFVGNRENLGLVLKAGLGAALYLSLVGTSAVLDARRGQELGLVQEVVPAGDVLRRALELADTINRNSPSAMANELRTLWAMARLHYDDAVAFGWELLAKQQQHPDSVEGPRAFAEKREARWLAE